MSFLGVDADTANANKPAFNTTIAGIAGVDETSIVALSFADFFLLDAGDGVDQCFLDGGDCASCCPDCDVTTSRDSSAADRCVCYEAVLSDYEYMGITLSDYDDCLHITGDNIRNIFGRSGNDVIVITGDGSEYIWGGRGDDVITITGDRIKEVNGDYDDDIITIIGDDSRWVHGGRGDDTIIIYGNNPESVRGGSDHDSCSIIGEFEDDEVHSCEREADVPLVSTMKVLYDIKVEDVDEANEISGTITSAEPAAVSVEGLENVTCLSIDAPATYSTFA